MSKRKTPEIRFAGFTGDWKKKKFADITDRITIQSNSKKLPKVEFEDIVSGEGRLNKDISQKFDTRKGIKFQPHNILFGKLRPYLRNWLFPDFQGIALGDFWVFETTNNSPSFVYSLIQTQKYQSIANLSSGTKMPRSDWKIVSTTEFFIPSSYEEQTRIGNFFKNLDDTIALHEQELEQLKQTKAGFLQKMFPAEGEATPALRFAGFAGEWEEKKWDSAVDISTNMVDPKSGKYDSLLHIGPGNIESFSGRILNNVKTVKEERLISGKFYFNAGEIIYGKINPQLGKYAIPNFEGLASADTYVLTVKRHLKQEFLYCILQTSKFYRYSVSVSMRTGMPKINRDELNQFCFLVPTLEEQTKIGNFFQSLDNLIALKEKELEGMKQTKAGFLQKMFI